jgi:acetyl esterase/lipase
MEADTFDRDLANDYDSLIRHPLPLPSGGKRWPVLISAQPIGYRPLTIDLRTPAGPGPHPVVVFIHGGAWLFGHQAVVNGVLEPMAIAETLLANGFAFAGINYRLSAEALFPAQLHDCKAAVRYLRKHAAALGLDGGRIAAMGESAGGHLTAMLALTGDNPAMEGDIGVTGISSAVQAAVNWYGPADFLTMNAQRPPHARQNHDSPTSPESLLVGAPVQSAPELARAASPISYVTGRNAPMLIHHGDRDRLVPVDQSRDLAAAIRAKGGKVELVEVPGADHCFWQGDTRQIMAQTLAFLRNHMPG